MTSLMFLLGFISLILAPFTGVTVWTAVAFFLIGALLAPFSEY